MLYNGLACKHHGVITICANHSINSKPQTEPQERKQLYHKVLEEFKILSSQAHFANRDDPAAKRICETALSTHTRPCQNHPFLLKRHETQSHEQVAKRTLTALAHSFTDDYPFRD